MSAVSSTSFVARAAEKLIHEKDCVGFRRNSVPLRQVRTGLSKGLIAMRPP
ncbi:MAG: hypothetical protein ACLUEQ_00975 [Cloacibacillus evryensis]